MKGGWLAVSTVRNYLPPYGKNKVAYPALRYREKSRSCMPKCNKNSSLKMEAPAFKYELFFELSPDLLCVAGYDGYFKKINPAVANTLGYSMEELYARPINDFVHPDDQDVTARARTELTRSKPLLHFENRYLTKRGETVWLSWTSLPVETDQLVFAVAKNITYKKTIEEERNALLASLSQANKDLVQLNYTTSHQLKSPVDNLLALFDLMDLSKISDQETIQLIEVLHYVGEKLKQTVNSYVDLTHAKSHEDIAVEETDLHECLQHALQCNATLIQTCGATVNADFSRLRKVMFNKAYMKSIFLNLLSNSIIYARPDCLPVISIHSAKGHGAPQLIIADNGLGMDIDQTNGEIFALHPMFQNRPGIGLYLVHSHITALGGHINVESKINQGTKFTISFAPIAAK